MSLDPSTWDRAVLDELAAQAVIGPKEAGRGRRVAASEHPFCTYAGLQALRAGGTAADALVAMVTTMNVITPGMSTLAGTMGLVYHDAPSGSTHAVNAGDNVARRDTEPYDGRADKLTGRSVLVPGMVAGLEAAWRRFGRLPWSDLLQPAIWFATEGFELYLMWAVTLSSSRDKLLRTAEGRAVFAPDGVLPGPGDWFRQPTLARTLERLAAEGGDYFYRGDWAEQCVAAVQRDGGLLEADDLAEYEVRWDDPLVGTYLDTEIRTARPPQHGGAWHIVGLNIAEALALHERPIQTKDPQTLYDLMQAAKAVRTTPEVAIDPLAAPELMADMERVLSKEHAAGVADRIRAGEWFPAYSTSVHSHHVCIVDDDGSMATATHTVHSETWGTAGIFVGGIALNGSAMQRTNRDSAGRFAAVPGGRVVEALAPYMAFRDGRPVLAAGAIGVGLQECILQNSVNVLGRGIDIATSIDLPRFGWVEVDIAALELGDDLTVEPFDAEVLEGVEALGEPVVRRGRFTTDRTPTTAAPADTGYWTAVAAEGDGAYAAMTEPRLWGLAAGDA